MPGFPHHRLAPFLPDSLGQVITAFDIKDDLCAGIARQHIGGKQHHQAIRPDDITIRTHNPQPIPVTIESKTDIGVGALHHLNQITQVSRLARIGMVIRKTPVHFAVEFDHFTTQGAKQFWRQRTGHTITTVNHNFQRMGQFNVTGNPFNILIALRVGLVLAGALNKVVIVDPHLQRLNSVAGKGFIPQDHLDAVVIRRIMTAGQHHSAATGEFSGGIIQHGCRYHPHIDDIHPGGQQSFHQGLAQFRTGQTPIAGKGDTC